MATAKERQKCETLIYKVLDAIDPSKQNSNYYKEKFVHMMNNVYFFHFYILLPLYYIKF